jgi:hypothetical protein
MTFNWSALATFVKDNPALVEAVIAPLADAALKDPSIIGDAIGLTRGGNVGAFVEKHAAAVTSVAANVAGEVTKNPALVSSAISAFTATGPVSASAGGQ